MLHCGRCCPFLVFGERLDTCKEFSCAHLQCYSTSSQARQLPGHALAELATSFVEVIKGGSLSNGKSLELFSTVLTALSNSKESLAYGKGNPSQLLLPSLSSLPLEWVPESLMFFQVN